MLYYCFRKLYTFKNVEFINKNRKILQSKSCHTHREPFTLEDSYQLKGWICTRESQCVMLCSLGTTRTDLILPNGVKIKRDTAKAFLYYFTTFTTYCWSN